MAASSSFTTNRSRPHTFPQSHHLLVSRHKEYLTHDDDDDDDYYEDDEDEDIESGTPLSDEDLDLVARQFLGQFLDRVSREDLPCREIVFKEDNEVDPTLLNQCGYAILAQVQNIAYLDLLNGQNREDEPRIVRKKSPRILAPETAAMFEDDDDDKANGRRLRFGVPSTCKIVPETMAFPENDDKEEEEEEEVLRRGNVFVNSFVVPSVCPKRDPKKETEEDKDLQIREKYGALDCIRHNGGRKEHEGVLGSGPSPLGRMTTRRSDEEKRKDEDHDDLLGGGSPSLLAREKKRAPTTKFLVDDDFKVEVIGERAVKAAAVAEAPAVPQSPPNKRQKKNRFGMTIEPVTLSQREKEKSKKQKSIQSFLKPVGSSDQKVSNKSSKVDSDLARALELSKQTLEEEQRRQLMDDSFDRLPDREPLFEDLGYKYAHPSVRGKDNRKKLLAFACHECERFYANDDLTEERRQELIQRCSKHRAKFAPSGLPSPQQPWKVGIESDQEKEQTQPYVPLRTKEGREAAKRKINLK